jgi:hypothetical protein
VLIGSSLAASAGVVSAGKGALVSEAGAAT